MSSLGKSPKRVQSPSLSNEPGDLVKFLTAKGVTCQPLIKYCDKGGRHVKSSSLHGLWFADDIKVWGSFEDEASNMFDSIPWDEHQTIIAFDLPKDGVASGFHLNANDHFVCGEELSISGRWVQHALHPMSAVSKVLKLNMVFGDWKATAEHHVNFVQAGRVDPATGDIIPFEEANEDVSKGKAPAGEETDTLSVVPAKNRRRKDLIPDYSLMMEGSGAPRAVGEAKTPWNHNFLQVWNSFWKTEDQVRMRQVLGQIGNYMIELGLKYGFLTNYDHTFFLKREEEEGRETLYCSPPISYNASTSRGARISVRQGLLFLQYSAQGDGWRAKKISDLSIIKKEKDEPIKGVLGRLQATIAQSKLGANHSSKQSQEPAALGDEEEGLASTFANMGIQGTNTRSRARFADPPVSGGRANAPESSGKKSRK
ncbi:hypothetical protein FQN49_004408 [Arthroderma sp. PD_2]|nr:hypothetical protein FQN49_004408 [Arthroderma sp. PD_2]